MSELINLFINIAVPLILFTIGWYFGTHNERKHLRELSDDEAMLGHIILSSERFYEPAMLGDSQGELVLGSVVIAQDYFKMTIASLLNLIGRNLTTYETLLERARREAIVRMKQQAQAMGHNQIYGVRLEVTNVDEVGKMVEAIAYGTAVSTVGNPKVPPALQSAPF